MVDAPIKQYAGMAPKSGKAAPKKPVKAPAKSKPKTGRAKGKR